MRQWMRVGCLVLSASAVACGSQLVRSPSPVEATKAPEVALSAGGGGAATVDTGEFPSGDEGEKSAQAKHALYDQVARELGVTRTSPEEGTGGSGRSAEDRRLCAEALDAHERVTLVSGIINFRSNGLLVVDVRGKGPVKLRTDEVTCAVQAGKAIAPASLSEGTEARVAYVDGAEGATARVIRAEPQRFQR
jgi:hypothetical protein